MTATTSTRSRSLAPGQASEDSAFSSFKAIHASPMNIKDFRDKLPAAVATKITEKTLALWHAIFSYVEKHGQADRFDRAFLDYTRSKVEYWVGQELAQRHLKRMADAGVLAAHCIVVRYTAIGKIMGGFGSLFRQGPSAGTFHCYTLPGMKPDLDMARYDPDPPARGH